MRFDIQTKSLFISSIMLALMIGSDNVPAAEAEHEDGRHTQGEHNEAAEGHADSVMIAPLMAQQAGITTASAGPGIIHETITVYGRTIIDPEGISQIRARFPGLVVEVVPGLGDSVTAGDIVAEVESNESLRRYTIQAPIDGVVTSRNANPGETTGEQPLLTVTNYDQLWAELSVFPLNARRIQAGQRVVLEAGGRVTEGSISHISPGRDASPAVIARVPLDNADSRWSPGLVVQASVAIRQTEVALAVDSRAIQTFENYPVVFVQEGAVYESRPVGIGRSDNELTEILSGLQPGDQYVVENSYLIKADLEKSSAEHDH